MLIKKSNKLDNVCYDIRGPILKEATRMEREGHDLIKLNIGNTAPFGLTAPEEIINEVIANINQAQGYGESKGILPAREAIALHCQEINIRDVTPEEIYIGNGISELIVMAMQGLLNSGDEILIPSPDYPLWTAAVNLTGGKPVHYLCDEKSNWYPNVADLEKKITSKTKGIVVINPNNPTGAVYSKETLEKIVSLAQKQQLIIFADEIYDKITYDGTRHTPIASLTNDILIITFNGLSKTYRLPGFRAGWMIISGRKAIAKDYLEGLDILASMRLCSNVPAQLAIPKALGGYQDIKDLTAPGGRLYEQRNFAYEKITAIPGISCVKPRGALYLFPKIDTKKFSIKDDEKFILDLLLKEKVLLVQGTGFNYPQPDHFRIVFLPQVEELQKAIAKIKHFLASYQQK